MKQEHCLGLEGGCWVALTSGVAVPMVAILLLVVMILGQPYY